MTSPEPTFTQDELKTQVGRAALDYVVEGEIVGVGTGSTVNKFIDALATIKDRIKGAVSSSTASTERLPLRQISSTGRFRSPLTSRFTLSAKAGSISQSSPSCQATCSAPTG